VIEKRCREPFVGRPRPLTGAAPPKATGQWFLTPFFLGGCLAVQLPVADVVTAAEPAARDAFSFAVELVRGPDPDMRAVALERLRDGLRGEAYTRELAETVLPALPAPVQCQLLSMLAGRRDPVALAGIVSLADAADRTVAVAAIQAIAALGNEAEVPLLVERLAGENPVGDAARRGLAAIQGPGVSAALVAAAADAELPVATRRAILEILAERRDRIAIPALLTAAVADEPTLRAAAMRSLAAIGGATEVPGMVAGLLAAFPGEERSEAERALVLICRQGPDPAAAAAALLTAYRAADPVAQQMLLPTLARIGGADVLAMVDALVADPDPAARMRGLEALTRWPDAAVTDRLLKLLEQTTDERERSLAVGTLIRIAPIPDNGLSDADRLALLVSTITLCPSDAERRRVLERAAAIRTVETLRFVRPYLDQEPLAESAAKGVVELAHHQKLRDANKAEFMAALERVLAVAKDPVTRERAARYREGKTWERR
jgi:HEAT repeat protein